MGEPIQPPTSPVLSADVRRLHRALLQDLVMTGVVSPPSSLAVVAEIAPEVLPAGLSELVAGDYGALDAAGRLVCLYPLSVVPTPHAVHIDGQRRYPMCAIDALGIPEMIGRTLVIESECGACHRSLRLVVGPGEVVSAEPAATVVVMRGDTSLPAAATCCPFTVFACGEAHGRALVEQTAGTRLLALGEALIGAEALFGDLLRADSLPAKRRRWRRTAEESEATAG